MKKTAMIVALMIGMVQISSLVSGRVMEPKGIKAGDTFVYDKLSQYNDVPEEDKVRIYIEVKDSQSAIVTSESPTIISGDYRIHKASPELLELLGEKRVELLNIKKEDYLNYVPISFFVLHDLPKELSDRNDVMVISPDHSMLKTLQGVFRRGKFKRKPIAGVYHTPPVSEAEKRKTRNWNRVIFVITAFGLMVIIAAVPWYIVTYLLLNNFVYGGKSPLLTDYFGRNVDDKVPTEVAFRIYVVCFIICAYPAIKIAWGWFGKII